MGTAPSLRSELQSLHGKSTAARPRATPVRPAAAKPAPFARKPVLEEFEARLLMSADLNPLAQDTLLATPATLPAEFRALAPTSAPTVVTSAAVAPLLRTNELVFVDTATPEYATLVEAMRESALAQGRHLEFVLIDAERDGIRKITDTLAKRSGLDAVHIISHATDGAVQLGAATLDFDSLVKRAGAIKKWGNALTENGDILIYGCDLAASAEGKSLVEALARLTGADVAASEDLTGARAKGGDWELEFRTGAIETAVTVGAEAQANYTGALQAVAQGGETRANVTTGNTQVIEEGASKQVAVAGDGSYVVAWVSQNQDGSGTGIYARRFNANGTAINAADILVNQTTLNDQREPAVATDLAGNFVVMWDSFNGTDYDVYARRFNAAGTALGNEFQGNTTTGGHQRGGGIAMTPDGRFVIGWADENGLDGSGAGAYVRFYDAAGNATTGEIRANATTAGNQYLDSVAIDANGNAVVVGTGDNIDGNGTGVFGRRFDSSGNPIGGQFTVNTQTTGAQSYASVASAADGRFIVSWTDYNAIGSDIRAQRYNADGTAAGGQINVNTFTANNQEFSSVASDMNGNFTVTWSSFGQDAAGTSGVYKQDFHSTGAADGVEVRVNTTTLGNQVPSSIGMNGWGEYVVAWDGNGAGDADGVFFQRFVGSLIVDTASDVSDGVTTSIANLIGGKGADGFISLREAILATNATVNTGGFDRIYFRIGGPTTTGVKVIAPLNANGQIAVTGANAGLTLIDGTTQPGYGAGPVIEIRGDGGDGAGGVAGTTDGLQLQSNGNLLRGLAFTNFSGDGLEIQSASNVITRSWFGVDAATSAARGNQIGIRLNNANSDTNTIGGSTAADRNVISGNTQHGIAFSTAGGATQTGNRIEGNYIGVNPLGTTRLANTLDAVNIAASATGVNIIGNVIGLGNDGIEINPSNSHVIRGNFIGTDPTGTLNFGNAADAASDGIDIQGNSDLNIIGGTAVGQRNVIANAQGVGIRVGNNNADQNQIRGNDIFANVAGGILLNGHIQEPTGDGDGVANQGQNYPNFTTATVAVVGGNLQISGITLPGINGNTYAIDFFANPAAGLLQGKRYLGSTSITVVAGGTVTFNATLVNAALLAGERVSATATTTAGAPASEIGNTSPFSANSVVAPAAGTLSISGTIYEDVSGDGSIADGVVRAGVTVRLYADNGDGTAGAGDLLVATATTDAAGLYTFTGLTNGNYWVAVDSRTITPAAGTATPLAVWAEQTYGVAEAWTGSGVLGATGAFFGGKSVNVSDNAAVGLANSEHILRANVGGASVAGRDAGFSFVAVTNTRGDNTDDDTGNARTQQGSLRQFIQNSNAINGVQSADFSINYPAGGVQTIVPTVALPDIIDTVILDATTQEGAGTTPRIALDGNGLVADGLTLTATADGSTIRGFLIRDFGNSGIEIQAGSTGNVVAGNWIGAMQATTGVAAAGEGNDGVGVYVVGAGNTIGGAAAADANVISGNALSGIVLDTGAGNTVRGNTIGLLPDGDTMLANGDEGIQVLTASNSTIRGNVVSGNTGDGVWINNGSGHVVAGNTIGLNAAGGADRGNAGYGVITTGVTGATIGGTTAADRNVISGNSFDGVRVSGASTNVVVAGNYIGTDAAGTLDLGNSGAGVSISNASTGNTIGGIAAGAGNVISGNTGSGVLIDVANTNGNALYGNLIGTDRFGTGDVHNDAHGVSVAGPGVGTITGAIVGGTAAGEANTIRFNLLDGVSVSGNANEVRIVGNAISDNVRLGINLVGSDQPTGVTLNDEAPLASADNDAGPNGLQNFANLSSVLTTGTDLIVTGSLRTLPGTYHLHLYASTAPDASGYGEGARYVGTFSVVVPGGRQALFTSVVVPTIGAVAANEWITATGTYELGGTLRQTSEFSAAIQAAQAPSISGTIFDDVDADADVAEASTERFRNVDVRLFRDDGDGIPNLADGAAVQTVQTNATGGYTFTGLTDGVYWVVVDSRDIGNVLDVTYNGGFGPADVWAEQTYAAANNTALASGGAVRAVYYNGSYQLDDTAGAFYGGLRSSRSDDGATLNEASAVGAEHIQRVTLVGADVIGVDSGFSFKVVTNVRGDGGDDDGGGGRHAQGTLDQFILNANSITGANTMRFVPAVAANVVNGVPGGGDDWWRITLTAALPQITGAGTTIDGTAYSSADGVTALDATNAGNASTATFAGVDNIAFTPVARPELEIVDGGALDYGLVVAAGGTGSSIQDLAIYGFGRTGGVSPQDTADINIAGGGVTVQRNVVGMTAQGVDPGVAARSQGNGVRLDGGDNGFVQNNLIGFEWRSGVEFRNVADGWFIQSNEIRENAWAAPNDFDGINLVSGTGNAVRWNLLTDNRGPGVDLANQSSTAIVENNTITNNALAAGAERFGLRATSVLGTSANLVSRNVITNNMGVGVLVNDFAAPYFTLQITQNSIYGNTGIGIDLNGGPIGTAGIGDGVTSDDPGDGDAGGNSLFNRPTLTGASLSAGNVTIIGSYTGLANQQVRIEFFASSVADPSGSGEGQRYIGYLDLTTDGAGTQTISTTFVPLSAVTAGEVITATATRSNAGFAGFFETSEFSNAVGTATLGGRILEDVAGDGSIGADPGRDGVVVRLYRDDPSNGTVGAPDVSDIYVGTATTAGGGYYAFSSLADATYWVVVDSRTFGATAYNGAGFVDDVWADQTYGVAGAMNGAGSFLGAAGTLYGGSAVGIADNPFDATIANSALIAPEHITRVVVSGANAANVDSGFSFNAVVNNRGDNANDDVVAGTDRLQQGSLHQFLLNANAISGVQSSNFSINYPAGGAQTIAVSGAALPTITDAVILDATTQEGWTAAPIVELDGSGSGGAFGLRLQADGTTVRGFVINRFSYGLYVQSSNNLIVGNWIGLDATGTLARGNAIDGIVLVAGVANNTIGGIGANDRNVISDSGDDGVSIDGASGTVVIGNYIGTNAAGTAALGNAGDGVAIQSAGATPAVNNRVGGTTAAERNVISGNASNAGNGLANVRVRGAGTTGNVVSGNYVGTDVTGLLGLANPGIGVLVTEAASGNTIGGATAGEGNLIAASAGAGIELNASSNTAVRGNFVGTDVTGNTTLGNATFGIWIVGSSGNTIGGISAGARNVVSGNLGDDGIEINGAAATGNVIQGNYVGLGADGSTAVGNAHTGIAVVGGTGNMIGGTAAGAGNVISANAHNGVYVAGNANSVLGNWIGTDAGGTLDRGNTFNGVQVLGQNNLIGGAVANAGNVIAFNDLAGVAVNGASAGGAILANSIHSNAGLGIDIEGDGVTANDAGDGDAGGNNRQNFPVLATAVTTGTDITVTGSINSTASRTFRLEFFASPTGDASGFGEGRMFLGTVDVTTDGTGNATFTTPAFAAGVPVNYAISATATDLSGNDTSEFSASLAAAPSNTPPVAADNAYTTPEDTTLTVDWWHLDWARRQQVTLLNAFAGSEALANFPVLLALNASTIDYAQTQDDGGDLRFFDPDGTALAYEVQSWNEAGDSYVWVKVPQIDTTGSDTITMYYGNAGVADGENPTAVWSGNGFRSAYHLDETGAAIDDAAAAGFDGSALNGTGPVAGFIGGAQNFDRVNNYIDLGANRSYLDNAAAATFSAWVFLNANDGIDSNIVLSASINNGGAPSSFSRVALEIDPFGALRLIVRADDVSSTVAVTTTQPVTAGQWHYIVGAVDLVADTVTVYVDGSAFATGGAINLPGNAFPNSPSASSSIGASDDGAGPYFNGRIDEARIATAARTIGWVRADYRAIANQAGSEFVAFGAQQAAPATGGVLANDTDADGNPLTVALVANVSNGTLTLRPNGTFTYTPNTNFFGTDTFTYRANDGTASSNVATVTITVTPVNDAPTVATNAGAAVNEGGAVVIGTAALSVSDVDNTPAQRAYAVTVVPANGQLEFVGAPGVAIVSFTQADIDANLVRYVHDGSETTSDSFSFTVSDGAGGSIGATVFAITVTPVNDLPAIGNLNGDARGYAAGSGAVTIDQGAAAAVTDADSGNFDGGNLTVTIAAGEVAAEDVLVIDTSGTVSLSAGMSVGSVVSVAGTAIGTVASNGSGGNDLAVNFNAGAALARINTLLQAVAFQNVDVNNPTPGARTVRFSVNDGDGGTSSAVDATITVKPVASIAATDPAAGEPANNGRYTVSLSATSATDTTVSYSIGGTATPGAGNDYTTLTGSLTILAGATTAVIDVLALDDALLEAAETVVVTLTGITAGDGQIRVDGTADAATVTIADNDTANAVLTVTTNGVEGGTNIVYTVTLSAVNGTGSTISFDFDDLGTGTATSGADYTAIPGAALINVANGASTGTFTVTVTDDGLLEATETVAAQISNSSNGAVSITGAAATANITDNDTASAVLAVTTQGVEGGTNIVYTVTLSAVNNTGSAITFDFDDLGTGTAISAADYTAIPGAALISVAAGASTGTFTVTVTDDALLEATETVSTQISNSSNAAVSITGAAASANISDNDTANAILSVTTQGVEGGTNIVYTVTLSAVNATGAAISFDFDDLGTGTATSGADYTAIPGAALISVAAGASTGTFTVTVTDDALLEATETLAAQIFNPSNAAVTITGAAATANITDNDAANAVLSVTTQGAEGGTNIVYTVTLSAVNNTGAAISFDLDDLGTGTATSGADYTAVPVAVLISVAAGASTGTFTVTVADDALLEATETVSAQISNSSNAAVSITGATATANITDNDTANAVLSVTTQGVEGGTNIVYTVTLSAVNATGAAISFDLDDLGTGTATSGADYTAVPGAALISVANGASTGTFTVTVTDDALLEVTETVATQISNSSNAAVTITGAAATANITDNDTANAVLSVTTQGVEGGTNIVYTVTLSAVNGTGSTISFDFDDLGTGTATSGADYTAIPGAALISVANGASTGTFTVTVTDDALLEATETVVAQISNSSNAAVSITGAAATANITDNDTANAVLSVTTQGVEGGTNIVYTVTLSAVNNTAAAISFDIDDLGTGTATSGADYTAVPGAALISVAAGASSGTFTVTVADDALLEVTETLAAQISNSSNAAVSITGAAATANITDNDTANAVLSVTTQGVEGGTNIVYTVTLSAVNATGAAISFDIDDLGTGTAISGADYTAIPGAALISVANGASSGTFTVTVTDDALLEATETVSAQISNSSNAAVSITGATATANITDNDTASAVLAVTTQGVEGGTNIVYTVTLSAVNNTGSAITFDFDDLGTGTAISAADYTAIPGAALISVAAGASTGTFTVTVTDDALLEATETVSTQISNSSNAAVSITGAAASANISDNDTANAILSVTTQGVEGGTNIVYTVTLSAVNATGAAITFDFDDLGTGTAAGGADYTAVPGAALISVAAGANSGTFTVTVTDDALLEATETLAAQISNPSNAAVTITGSTAAASISDNDTALASVAATTQAAEPATNGQFTVTLSQASSTDTIISYVVSGTATPGAGNDYVAPVAGTVTILAGATTATIDVVVLDDPFVEAPESVVVTLTGIVAGDADIAIDGAANSSTVNIASDDVNLAPAGLADMYAMAEDGTLTVFAAGGVLANDTDPNLDPLTAVLAAGPANGSLTLNADGSFTYQPNADWNGTDSFTYRAADGSLQSGTVMVTITVAPVNDAPALGNNSFAISSGGTLVLAAGNLSGSDVDNAAGSLVFVIGALANGQFELVGTPGAAIGSFTQTQVLAGQVQFVHLGAGAPAFNITVSDGASPVGPVAANIVFTGAGVIISPPSGGGDTGGGTTLPSISLPPVFPLVPPSLVSPSVSAFLPAGNREEFEEAGSRFTEAAEPVVVAPVAAESQRIAQPDMQLPTVRSQGDIIETTLQRPEVTVEPLRAEMQVIPTKQGLDLSDEESQRIEIVLNSVRITGIALSVGAVWWAARAAGLVASLLASTPAWRHVDPLPVLGRDEEDAEEDQWSESDQSDESAEDRERRDDEHRAAWVLEDRESRL